MSTRSDEIDRVLVALADPTRRRVLDAVASQGESTATRIAAELPVSRQAVVKHLAVLDRAGLVTGRREGREMLYVVQPEQLDATARWIAGLAAEWDRRLARIKRLAEAPSDREDRAPSAESRAQRTVKSDSMAGS
jgi:DNA-binding transcriptional ArsR family regulator